MSDSSRFIVYVDESGDHSLTSIDEEYPVFVLAFSIFDVEGYVDDVVPRFQKLKFEFFGHDQIVLHGREIKQQQGPFSFDGDISRREKFMDALNVAITETPATLVACVINKRNLSRRYYAPANPYELALEFGLERVISYVTTRSESQQELFIIVESRGKKEDQQLQVAFERFARSDLRARHLSVKLVFVNKKANSAGMQFSDLVARPIGQHVLNPTSGSRAWQIIEPKLRRAGNGKIDGYGLKVFP